jgi:hypothetical protein
VKGTHINFFYNGGHVGTSDLLDGPVSTPDGSKERVSSDLRATLGYAAHSLQKVNWL